MPKEKKKLYSACLSCPHNISSYGKCEKGYENWYFRISKKNGCSLCEKAPTLSTKQIAEIQKKKEEKKKTESVDKVRQESADPDMQKPASSEYTIYTDGGCASNPGGPGGIGVVLINDKTGEIREISEGYTATTNNRMEMMAVIRAAEHTKEGDVLHILTDSQYVVNCITGTWRKKTNHDLWERMSGALSGKKAGIKWIPGHSGIKENERCDELATCGMRTLCPIKDEGYRPEEFQVTAKDLTKENRKRERQSIFDFAVNKTGAMGVPIHVEEGTFTDSSEKRILELRKSVSPACARTIRELETSSRSFKSYASIRTGGMDEISRLATKALEGLVPETEQKEISKYIPGLADRTTCMRWRIRGLSLKDSIRKVLVDTEIRENFQKSKNR